MKDRQFAVVSNNKIYFCNGIEELKSKTDVLRHFNITYRVYYLLKDEWTELYITMDELLQSFKEGFSDGLKGVSKNGF